MRSGLSHENFSFEQKTPWGAERSEKGIYEQRHSNNMRIRSEALLSYDNYFLNNQLSLDALAGFSYNYNESNSSGFGGKELTTPNSFGYNSLPANVRQSRSEERRVGREPRAARAA